MDTNMLTFLKTEVMLTPDYEDEEIKLCATKAPATLRLFGGPDQAIVEGAVGRHKSTGETIIARMEISYYTDIPGHRIDLCGNDPVPGLSAQAVWYCPKQEIHRACLYLDQPNGQHPLRQAAMQKSLQAMHHSISDAALAAGITVGRRNQLGPYEDRHFVLRGDRISHLFDPMCDDFDTCKTIPVNSSYHSVVTFPSGTIMINVIGSSGDQYPDTSLPDLYGHMQTLQRGRNWMNFWSFCTRPDRATNERPACGYYAPRMRPDASGLVNGHHCNATQANASISGNHSLEVIGGVWPVQEVPKRIPGVPNPDVFIIAACASSNHHPNNSFIMQVRATAVKLQNYYIW